MTRQAWAAQIRNARTSAEQLATIKALKNEIVGHPLKKESMVIQGALDPVVRLVFNKSSSGQDSKAHDHTFAPRALNQEELIRLQGIQIVGSIALGGPPFLGPLQAASALPAILTNLCPSNNPAQLVLASLRALSNLAESSALATGTRGLSIATIADILFSRQNLAALSRILSQTSLSTYVQSQIAIAASLISRVCVEERHQQGLANSGVLDALASKVAAFVVADGIVIPGAEILAQRDGLQEYFPQVTLHSSNFSIILDAVSVIIADSKLRASQFLYSPWILATLPITQLTELSSTQYARSAWNAFNSAGLCAHQNQLNAVDYLLPFVPLHPLKSGSQTSAFPPLGTSGSRENLNTNGRSLPSKYTVAPLPTWGDSPGLESGLLAQDGIITDEEEPESPLIAYLILSLRSRTGMERLMAAAVLTVLYRAGLTHKSRETTIGLLVVPLIVYMLDETPCPIMGHETSSSDENEKLEWAIREKAPAVLAMLITDSEYLQKAAVDAGAIPKLSKLIKVSYDPVPDSENPQPWAPHLDDEHESMEVQPPRLGLSGQTPLLAHKIKVRETTLKAIAALAPFKDEYRKALVDQGIMPYVVESMNSHPNKPSAKISEQSEKIVNGSTESEKSQGYGVNSISVLIAACGAVRALSRSVSVLRTTLIDNGVAEPSFRLMQHPDIEVQIAATATVCNLVTDVSPMRETIAAAGVVKVLCEHAHSMNAKLRLNAVWALKHFVQGVSNDMKRLCLEELGQGWLIHLICDDTEDEALLCSRNKIERSKSNDVMDEDTEMDQFEEELESAFGTRTSMTSRPSNSGSKWFQQAQLRLANLRNQELNPGRKARKDDIAVQEQGLDFIRNLIGDIRNHSAETTDMIDFLFDALGQDRVFDILASKLRPKAIYPYNRRHSTSPESKIIPPQPEILIAVSYILVHMAASVPRHRQLVIAQKDLLKLLVPQLNHPNVEVRLALCWLVTNLTWMDDQNDGQACAARANELRKLGFLDRLEGLENDPELNVRERAKSALWQMKQGYS